MQTDYRKLWNSRIDRNMTKNDLRYETRISVVMHAKLGKDESITTGVLLRICEVLKCYIGDIVKVISIDKQIPYKSDIKYVTIG